MLYVAQGFSSSATYRLENVRQDGLARHEKHDARGTADDPDGRKGRQVGGEGGAERAQAQDSGGQEIAVAAADEAGDGVPDEGRHGHGDEDAGVGDVDGRLVDAEVGGHLGGDGEDGRGGKGHGDGQPADGEEDDPPAPGGHGDDVVVGQPRR